MKWSDDNGINDPGTGQTPAAYLKESCIDDRSGNWPTIVGEFSLSVADNLQYQSDFTPNSNVAWYQKWFAAQIIAYENQEGWIFWNWKADWIGGVNDWRWSYQGKQLVDQIQNKFPEQEIALMDAAAIATGAIPKDLNDALESNPCSGI